MNSGINNLSHRVDCFGFFFLCPTDSQNKEIRLILLFYYMRVLGIVVSTRYSLSSQNANFYVTHRQ